MADDDQSGIQVVDRRWWARGETAAGGTAVEPFEKPTYVQELETRVAAKDEELRATLTQHLQTQRVSRAMTLTRLGDARFATAFFVGRPLFGQIQSLVHKDVFVLRDNRDNSRDSRFWGFVPTSDIVGVARIVYFSWDPNAGRVRWERIGRPLR